MNLMSAVLGAAGVAILYGIVLVITRHHLIAAFTALLFAFTLAFWSQTGITEVYAPNVFMVTLTVWLLLKWGEAERVNRLPYKASTLNAPLMMRDAPRTLEGIYRYTLGAFPQIKFAFPLWAIPDRIVLYLHLLQQNFGVWGILLGLYGMMEMAFRDVKKFYLYISMYLVHVFFFVQYRALVASPWLIEA